MAAGTFLLDPDGNIIFDGLSTLENNNIGTQGAVYPGLLMQGSATGKCPRQFFTTFDHVHELPCGYKVTLSLTGFSSLAIPDGSGRTMAVPDAAVTVYCNLVNGILEAPAVPPTSLSNSSIEYIGTSKITAGMKIHPAGSGSASTTDYDLGIYVLINASPVRLSVGSGSGSSGSGSIQWGWKFGLIVSYFPFPNASGLPVLTLPDAMVPFSNIGPKGTSGIDGTSSFGVQVYGGWGCIFDNNLFCAGCPEIDSGSGSAGVFTESINPATAEFSALDNTIRYPPDFTFPVSTIPAPNATVDQIYPYLTDVKFEPQFGFCAGSGGDGSGDECAECDPRPVTGTPGVGGSGSGTCDCTDCADTYVGTFAGFSGSYAAGLNGVSIVIERDGASSGVSCSWTNTGSPTVFNTLCVDGTYQTTFTAVHPGDHAIVDPAVVDCPETEFFINIYDSGDVLVDSGFIVFV